MPTPKKKTKTIVPKQKSPLLLLKKRRFLGPVLIITLLAIVLGGYFIFQRGKAAIANGPDSHFLDNYQQYSTAAGKDTLATGNIGTITVNQEATTSGFYYANTAWMLPANTQVDPVSGHTNGDAMYIGIQTASVRGKIAVFSMWNATDSKASPVAGAEVYKFDNEGFGRGSRIPFNWQMGRKYQVIMNRESCNGTNCWWVGSIKDTVTNAESVIGRLYGPYNQINVQLGSTYFHELFSPMPADCNLPKSTVRFDPAIMITSAGNWLTADTSTAAVSKVCTNRYQNTLTGAVAISQTGVSPSTPAPPVVTNPGNKTPATPAPTANPATKATPVPAPAATQAPAAATTNPAQKPAATPVPATPPPAPACPQQTTGQGNQGGCVTLIQQRLVNLGYDPGAVDGVFGDKTFSAVKIFQNKNGLTVDGIVGPNTWARLFDANAARKS